MRTRFSPFTFTRTVVAACSLAIFVFSTSAQAAEIKLDRACYLTGMDASVSGSGFTANTTVNFSLDGQAFGNSTADATGSLAAKFKTPAVDQDTGEKAGTQSASASLSVTQLAAGFALAPGSSPLVNKAKVRFSVFGYGLLKGTPNVFAHYIQPNGQHVGTIKIGQSEGPCGKINPSKVFKFYPFKAKLKKFILLQIDTQAKYKKADENKDPIFVVIKVPIKKVVVRREVNQKNPFFSAAGQAQLGRVQTLL